MMYKDPFKPRCVNVNHILFLYANTDSDNKILINIVTEERNWDWYYDNEESRDQVFKEIIEFSNTKNNLNL